MPNSATFTILPIKTLLDKYVHNGVWADPFAGNNSPALYTNDLNPKTTAHEHIEADSFMNNFADAELDGVLFDPPYSPRQITECYAGIGRKATMLDTSSNFHAKIKDTIARKIKPGGKCISFGWNSNGLGANRGFEKDLIVMVAHGGMHNDTICVVETKIQTRLETAVKPIPPTAVGILGVIL